MSMRGKRGKNRRLRRRKQEEEKELFKLSSSSFEPAEENLYHLNGASALKGVWEKFKLKEIISDPAFLGKTIRLGDSIFEVKGLDERIAQERRKKELGKDHPHKPVVI